MKEFFGVLSLARQRMQESKLSVKAKRLEGTSMLLPVFGVSLGKKINIFLEFYLLHLTNNERENCE